MRNGILIYTSLLGVVVLGGWHLGIEEITHLKSNVAMMPMTALSFVMISTSMILSRIHTKVAMILSVWMASTILATMIILLFEALTNYKLGMASLFTTDLLDSGVESVNHGEPSLGTMTTFATAGWLSIWETITLNRYPKAWLFLSGIGAVCTMGYALKIPSLHFYIPGHSSSMAWHTGITFLLMGWAGYMKTGEH